MRRDAPYRGGMRLILVRHGDAHAGFHGVIGGRTGCTGLTDLGRQQAEALRDRMEATGAVRADALVSSVLPRAIETAQIIGPGLGIELGRQECDLCEVHTGEADGLTWAEYGTRYGGFDMHAEPDRVFAPGGDSWNSFHERVGLTLERLRRDHAGETVVVVCHAGVIMASLRPVAVISKRSEDTETRLWSMAKAAHPGAFLYQVSWVTSLT